MHKLVEQKLGIFKKQKIEIILTKNFRSLSTREKISEYYFVNLHDI
jgi:hypothetical protein